MLVHCDLGEWYVRCELFSAPVLNNRLRSGEPRIRGRHRPDHHCEYPYAAFFARFQGFNNYVDTKSEFLTLDVTDPESNDHSTVSVGHLLRWKSRGPLFADQNLLYVRVGRIWKGFKYHFHAYTEAELDAAGRGETGPLIFCNSDTSDEYAKASWIIENDLVVGVRAECKVKSHDNAAVSEVRFTQFPLTCGETTVVAKAGLVELPSKTPIVLGPVSYNVEPALVPDLTTVIKRDERHDFLTWDAISGDRSLTLAEPEVTVEGPNRAADWFRVSLRTSNAGAETHSLEKFTVEWKLLNETEWKEVDAKNFINWGYGSNPLPLFLGPKEQLQLDFKLGVPFAKPFDSNPGGRKSLHAVYKPLRLRFVFTDPKGKMTFRVAEHVHKPYDYDAPKVWPCREDGDAVLIALFLRRPRALWRWCWTSRRPCLATSSSGQASAMRAAMTW